MRFFKDGDEIWIEPWRAAAFPVLKDLCVDRSAFDRVIAAGGFITANCGSAPDANDIPIAKEAADRAMDAAACIGCGACVAACPNGAAQLFTSAKLQHLNLSLIRVRDWSPIKGLTALTHLELTHSDLKSAGVLSGMKQLKRLNLSESKDLKDISGLRMLTDMEQLRLDDCPVTSLDAVAGMDGLHVLSAAGTKVTNISPLSNLSDLRSVDLQRTGVMNFDPLLGSAKSLRYLGLPKGTESEQYQAITDENHKLKPEIAKRK